MANRFIAEVDAPEFGEGYTIRLDMHGQGELETQFGDFDFVSKVHFGLAVMNSKYLEAFLKAALRNAEGELVTPPVGNGAMPVPLEPVAKKCLDAFTLFRYGKDSETWAADNEAKQNVDRVKNPMKGTKA